MSFEDHTRQIPIAQDYSLRTPDALIEAGLVKADRR
jgi:hypothetical protein